MGFRHLTWPAALSGVLFVLLAIVTARSEPPGTTTEPMLAEFRGCDSEGWCRFWIDSLDPLGRSLHRVYPDGVAQSLEDDDAAVAVRDRLNALLASMVHQHKRIVLHDLREVEDGKFAASISVNGVMLDSDSVLVELQRSL